MKGIYPFLNSIEPNEISANKKPYKSINSIKGLSSGKKLFYIGTPFIDLAFGSTLVDELILNIHKLHKPTMFVVQLPCNISNDIHINFYNKFIGNNSCDIKVNYLLVRFIIH